LDPPPHKCRRREKKTRGFSLAVGGLGILRTPPLPAGRDNPSAFGIHLTHRQVIGHSKVMDALFRVEEKYPHVGASMLKTFLPGQAAAQGEGAVGRHTRLRTEAWRRRANKEEGAGEGGEGDRRAIDYGASLMKRTSLASFTTPNQKDIITSMQAKMSVPWGSLCGASELLHQTSSHAYMLHLECKNGLGDVAMSAKPEVSCILIKRKPYPQLGYVVVQGPCGHFSERKNLKAQRLLNKIFGGSLAGNLTAASAVS
jgi:hypothetical protein